MNTLSATLALAVVLVAACNPPRDDRPAASATSAPTAVAPTPATPAPAPAPVDPMAPTPTPTVPPVPPPLPPTTSGAPAASGAPAGSSAFALPTPGPAASAVAPASGGARCTRDAECRVFSDYCKGCDCRALRTGDKDPSCKGPGVRCLLDPCRDATAACVNGACEVRGGSGKKADK